VKLFNVSSATIPIIGMGIIITTILATINLFANTGFM
jgi:hypothetical protein